MKKIYTTLVLLCAVAFANGQIVSIPDINFKLKLLSASTTNQIAKDLNGNWTVIDTNGDNLIQQSEANNISYLNITRSESSPSINSIQGILGFNNLEELNLIDISLTSLNLSSLTNLEILKYENYFGLNNFNSFNVSGCTNLKKFSLIDHLSINYINFNDYNNTGLMFDFSNLQNLEEFYFSYKVSESDILDSNAFNFTNCINLKKIKFIDQYVSSYNLNLQNLPNLKEFYYNGVYNVNSINLSNSTNLESFYYDTTSFGTITNANSNFSNFSNLNNFYFHVNGSLEINALSFDNCTSLESLDIYCGTHIGIINELDLQDCVVLENLSVSKFSIQNILTPNTSSLKTINITNTPITSLNLENKNQLESLIISNNQLTTLDLSDCGNLQSVNCDNNNLQFISFKNNTNETKSFLNNPNLTYICADDIEQQSVQLIVNLYEMWDTCVVGDYCSFTPNGNYNTISGNALYDNETNGCDTNDAPF
ncbi:hypothetical protein B0A77_15180, partial [Flavobacterium branchiophilum]